MKKTMLLMAMLLVSVMSFAKDYKTLVVTVSPQMRCANCETKVKTALQQVDGVKEVQTCLQSQMVAVKYDGQKTSKGKLVKAFKKIGYDAKVADRKCNKEGKKCDKKHKDCDKAKKECTGEHGCDKAKKECTGEHGCDKAKKKCGKQ